MGKFGEVPAPVQSSQPEMLGGYQPELVAPSLGVGMTPHKKNSQHHARSSWPSLLWKPPQVPPGGEGARLPRTALFGAGWEAELLTSTPSAVKSDPICTLYSLVSWY